MRIQLVLALLSSLAASLASSPGARAASPSPSPQARHEETLTLKERDMRPTGRHGGYVLRDRSGAPCCEVVLDSGASKVDAYWLDHRDSPPGGLSMVLHGEDGRNTLLELRPVRPLERGTAHYEGKLDPSAQSTIGIEVRVGGLE